MSTNPIGQIEVEWDKIADMLPVELSNNYYINVIKTLQSKAGKKTKVKFLYEASRTRRMGEAFKFSGKDIILNFHDHSVQLDVEKMKSFFSQNLEARDDSIIPTPGFQERVASRDSMVSAKLADTPEGVQFIKLKDVLEKFDLSKEKKETVEKIRALIETERENDDRRYLAVYYGKKPVPGQFDLRDNFPGEPSPVEALLKTLEVLSSNDGAGLGGEDPIINATSKLVFSSFFNNFLSFLKKVEGERAKMPEGLVEKLKGDFDQLEDFFDIEEGFIKNIKEGKDIKEAYELLNALSEFILLWKQQEKSLSSSGTFIPPTYMSPLKRVAVAGVRAIKSNLTGSRDSDDSGEIYRNKRVKSAMRLLDLVEERHIAADGQPMEREAFNKDLEKWSEKLGKENGVTCQIEKDDDEGGNILTMTTTIKHEDEAEPETIRHTYETDHAQVTMTNNPPSDRAILIFMASSNNMAPLIMQASCNNADTALRLFEASVISGTEIELTEDDQRLLLKSEYSDRYSQLKALQKEKGKALEEFKKYAKSEENYQLGKTDISESLSLPTSAYFSASGNSGSKPKKK